MTYLISNFVLTLFATLVLGVGIGWLIWGRLKNQMASLETKWQTRLLKLDNEYQTLAKDFNEVELTLKDRISHISTLNDERNELATKLEATTSISNESDSDIEEIKTQLGLTTARCHIISKELDKSKQELVALQNNPEEVGELKTLLGQATQRYNNNGLELRNKNEELIELQTQLDDNKKHTASLNKELELLRTQLLKRDKEFENQIVSYANLQNELNDNNEMLKIVQTELDSRDKNTVDDSELEARDVKIIALKNSLEEVTQQYQETQTDLVEAKKHIPALNNEVSSLRERIPALESSLKQRDSSISALEGEISRLAKEFPPLRDKLDIRDSQASKLKEQVYTLQQRIPALKSTIAARDAHIRELEVFIKDAQKAILKPANGAIAQNGNGNGNGNGSLLVDDDWDVPTFLRKKSDN